VTCILKHDGSDPFPYDDQVIEPRFKVMKYLMNVHGPTVWLDNQSQIEDDMPTDNGLMDDCLSDVFARDESPGDSDEACGAELDAQGTQDEDALRVDCGQLPGDP